MSTSILLLSDALRTKKAFLERWNIFLKKLEALEKEVERRTQAGYALQNRMPTQTELLQLSTECLYLSESYHGKGKGNLSCFYHFFYRINEKAQLTFYEYSALPTLKSADGFASPLDTDKKNKLQAKYFSEVQGPHIQQGGLWKGGRSAIDNTILSNVSLKAEAAVTQAAAGLKRLLVAYIQKKQKWIIKELRALNPSSTASDSELVRTHFQNSAGTSSVSKINKDSLALQLLLKMGKTLENWGQLPQESKVAIWKMAVEKSVTPGDSSKSLFDLFVKFVQENPGAFFDASKQLHWLIQITGLWSGKLVVFTRTKVENDSPIRYIPFSWTRKYNLENVVGGKKIVVRYGKSKETSMIRTNQGAYEPHHGMSMSTSGLLEGSENHNTLLYQLGIPLDPTATISNMHCDIEKILIESYLLNPKIPRDRLLPGEAYLTVGQNSVSGSSIKATQHTQIFSGTIEEFPVYSQLKAELITGARFEAKIELVQVGKKADAFYLKLTTDNPTSDHFLQCLIDLKMSLLKKFGGIEKIDFLVHSIPNLNGNFSVIFVPHVRLEVRDKNVFYNPDSGENHVALGLPAEHLHLANALGSWGIDFNNSNMLEPALKGGRETLEKLWDFTSKSGTRDCVLQFFQEKLGATLSSQSKRTPIPQMDPGTQSFWNSKRIMSYAGGAIFVASTLLVLYKIFNKKSGDNITTPGLEPGSSNIPKIER